MSDTGSCEPLNFTSVVGVQIPTGWSIFMQLQKDYGALNVTLACLSLFFSAWFWCTTFSVPWPNVL
jgi:hypothetical protein